MSVKKKTEYGYLLSHKHYMDKIYKKLNFELHPSLFKIFVAYKSKTNKRLKIKSPQALNLTSNDNELEEEVKKVEKLFDLFISSYNTKREEPDTAILSTTNKEALIAADDIYRQSGNVTTSGFGFNDTLTIKEINNVSFLFPDNCKFYCKDIADIGIYLKENKYDLILLDPPWWNKYIRRKRKATPNAYDMLYNEEIKNLPLENLLKPTGIIVCWCTNSSHHIKILKDDIFPKWGVKYIGKWYWVKVTVNLIPVCPFSKPPGKQPFEQIIFGCRNERNLMMPPMDQIILSIPSSLHSHKPPLCDILQDYLPESPECLEIFARYLLPNWTSYGREALRFQNECLFKPVVTD